MQIIEAAERNIEAGELALERALARLVTPRPSPPPVPIQKPKIKLSRRESQIIRFIAIGLRNSEIAERLEIGEQTVKNHLHNIFQKARVRDRLDLALFAVYHGFFKI
jgi:DNA-binding NarL/FixJ family response regulator